MSQNTANAAEAFTPGVSMIVAVADNGVIGHDNRLPWHLPADLAHFKARTLGKTVIMGRKTYDSIGKALPRRRNIVITANSNWRADNVDVAASLAEALEMSHADGERMIIGGATIYAQALPLAEQIYLTQVHAEPAGDTGFPEIDMREWWEIERTTQPADDTAEFACSFVTLRRRAA